MVYVKVLRRDTSITSQETIFSNETNEILLVFIEIELFYSVVFLLYRKLNQLSTYAYICTYAFYAYRYIYVHMSFMYTDIYVYMHFMYADIYAYICVLCIQIYICTYIYVYKCIIYICIYIFSLFSGFLPVQVTIEN